MDADRRKKPGSLDFARDSRFLYFGILGEKTEILYDFGKRLDTKLDTKFQPMEIYSTG